MQIFKKRKPIPSKLEKDEKPFILRPKDVLGNVETLKNGHKVELAKALIELESQENGRRYVHKNLIVVAVAAIAFAVIGLFMLMVTGDNGTGSTEINLLDWFIVNTQAIGVALLAVAAAVAIFGIRSVTKK